VTDDFASPLTDALTVLISAIRDIPDPIDRELAARRLDTVLTVPLAEARAIRRDAILHLRQGRTRGDVAKLLKLSLRRLDKLAERPNRLP